MLRAAAVLALSLPLLAAPPPAGAAEQGAAPRAPLPTLRVSTALDGLEQPWDVQPLGGGRFLVTERDRRQVTLFSASSSRQLTFPRDEVWSAGETGLMSLAVAPGSKTDFFTCHGHRASNGPKDVRVVAWRLEAASGQVSKSKTLLKGLPASTGRHGGCRLLITRNDALLVGTGDAATSGLSQRRTSLGGKVLRMTLGGRAWPSNPWPKAKSRAKRLVLTYGHRNVQGLAQRRDGSLWSVEHGSYRDDEVNKLRKGGNYGWAPGPGYDESVPMTDHRLPGKQISARWRSGRSTIATSGAVWVQGKRWGRLNGTLAVAALKGERVVFMKFTQAGRLRWTHTPAALRSYGRLRSVTRAPNGDLLITTANGSGDRVLRVAPRAR